MSSHLRMILAAAGILAVSAAVQPSLHAQGFGGMFSTFQMNGATDDNEEGTTMITASAADIDLENNIVTLIGDVVVDDNSSKITCNKMTIYLAEDAADSLVGTAEKPAEAAPKAEAKKEEKDEKPQAVQADGTVEKSKKDDDEDDDKKNISKIVCSGDVVYLKRANPDDPNGQDQIAMSEQADYDVQKEIIVMTGKPVMMQGSNKLHGDRIEILVAEGNRMRVINPVVYYTGQSLLTKPAEGSTRP